MANIGLFYGSTTGKTEYVAEIIQQEFGDDLVITLHNIFEVKDSNFAEQQYLIIACLTWNISELKNSFTALEDINFNGKKQFISEQ